MDGSTDCATIDDEMFLVVYCDIDSKDETVHTCVSLDPRRLMYKVFLQNSLAKIGISHIDSEQCKMLIGVGTDGASASNGLKGLGFPGFTGVGVWHIELN